MSLKVTQCQGWNSNLALTQRLLKPFWLHTQSWPHGYEISLPHRAPHPAAAAKSLQSCPTQCDPIDGSPPGSAIPGILQAITLEWVAISFSKAWKWKGKVKLLSHVWLLATPWTAAYQFPLSMGFSRQESWSGLPLPSLAPHPTLCLMLSCGSLEILVISEHGPCIFILQRAPQIMQLLLPVSQILLWRPS